MTKRERIRVADQERLRSLGGCAPVPGQGIGAALRCQFEICAAAELGALSIPGVRARAMAACGQEFTGRASVPGGWRFGPGQARRLPQDGQGARTCGGAGKIPGILI